DGDTVDFSLTTPATITLTSGELVGDKSVSITGPGPDQLPVNGTSTSRVFSIGPGKTVTISGLTITNGAAVADSAGGILNNKATLTVSNCAITGNWAQTNAGGIWNYGGNGSATLTINNSMLSGNSTENLGGGILNDGSPLGSATLTINNSTLSGNSGVFSNTG